MARITGARKRRAGCRNTYSAAVTEMPLLPDQPSTTDQVRRFGPPAIIAIAALIFVFQNTESVTFDYLWFDFSAPLWIMLIVFAAVGAVVFWGAARRRARRAKRD